MKLLCSLVAALAALFAPGIGNAYPNGPVRLLVGWPAGGPVDVPARSIAAELSKSLGVPVVVENKAGVNGMLAVDTLLGLPRDGQTLLLCTHYETMNPVMYKSAKYKSSDLAGISLIGRYYLYMTTSSSSPYRKLQDLIDSAKRNPGKLTYGTSGPGSSQEMLMRQLTDITKTEMVSVPFRGAGPALVEVVAGRLDSFLGPSGAVMPLANSNQVRILASTAPVRSAAIPDIPTFSELGFPLNLYGWLGVCTAKGTPPDIISTLNAKVTAITASAEYKRGLEATGQIPESTSPQELDKIMSGMTSEISDLVSKYGIRVD